MKARLRVVSSTKETPTIGLYSFNGDYEDYYIEISVNGIQVAVAPCPCKNCNRIGIGCADPKNKDYIFNFYDDITEYAKRILNSELFFGNENFFVPKGEIFSSEESNTQFQILSVDGDDSYCVVELLVNGAYVELFNDRIADTISYNYDRANSIFIEKHISDVSNFALPVIDSLYSEDDSDE